MRKKHLIVVLCLSFVWACGGHKHAGHDHDMETEEHDHDHDEDGDDEHDHDAHHHHPDAIILEPEKAEASGVKTDTVACSVFHDVIVTSGQIVEASCDESNIVASVPGIVTHTKHISEGTAVQKDAVLYHINSANMQEGDVTERAFIAYDKAQKEWKRAKTLMDENLITEREYNEARSEYEYAKLAYEAIGARRQKGGVSVASPETGFVKESFVKDGDYVEVGQKLMTITRNQHLYLRAEVPMRYYEQIERIQTARFMTALSKHIYSIDELDGHLLSAGKSMASTFSYIPVTFEFDNRGGIIPGSYAEVFLIAGDRAQVVSVPSSALTEEQGLYFVYIKADEHSYIKREVGIGASDSERVEITSGLQGGERIVVEGVMNVKLAGASKAVPGHTHNH